MSRANHIFVFDQFGVVMHKHHLFGPGMALRPVQFQCFVRIPVSECFCIANDVDSIAIITTIVDVERDRKSKKTHFLKVIYILLEN